MKLSPWMGFSLGKLASFALLQSIYSVLSFAGDSQKARSSASLANSGVFFNRFGLYNGSLLSAHVTR